MPSQSRHILTPTKLNRLARTLLQTEIGLIWLQAEVSNFVAAASGHWYFTLKDNKAQIRAAMFKQANFKTAKRPNNGDKVLIRASVSLYEPRGDYQLIVEHLELDGEGALKREFELLKSKLSQQGLFAAEKKRPLPSRIQTIGVITSDSGAALHDVLSVLKRRAPDLKVIIYPTLVQGELASQELQKALAKANQRKEVDVLLLTRGGGSLEDLWAFNNEQLAYDIANSPLPTVSAVGHEIDFTICDMVADIRAPTPSAAAELVSPDNSEREQRIKALLHRLCNGVNSIVRNASSKQQSLHKSLSLLHPEKQLQQNSQYLDNLDSRLRQAMQWKLSEEKQGLKNTGKRLHAVNPSGLIQQQNRKLKQLTTQMCNTWQSFHQYKTHQLSTQAGYLHALSPLATLSRGYSIAFQQDKAISSVKDIDMNEALLTKFHDGDMLSQPLTSHKEPKA